jgi:hypothetical protein
MPDRITQLRELAEAIPEHHLIPERGRELVPKALCGDRLLKLSDVEVLQQSIEIQRGTRMGSGLLTLRGLTELAVKAAQAAYSVGLRAKRLNPRLHQPQATAGTALWPARKARARSSRVD